MVVVVFGAILVKVEAALLQVGFDVIFVLFLLPSMGALSFVQLAVQHLFRKAVVRHVYDMASPS